MDETQVPCIASALERQHDMFEDTFEPLDARYTDRARREVLDELLDTRIATTAEEALNNAGIADHIAEHELIRAYMMVNTVDRRRALGELLERAIEATAEDLLGAPRIADEIEQRANALQREVGI
jgi:hypothetical protein